MPVNDNSVNILHLPQWRSYAERERETQLHRPRRTAKRRNASHRPTTISTISLHIHFGAGATVLIEDSVRPPRKQPRAEATVRPSVGTDPVQKEPIGEKCRLDFPPESV